ncbi:hypothetical protein ACIPYQ_40855 [Streptomyces sp. NPDC090045]|uniref:hypothetical protein n=1 Tax=Streptomyces sp. NPDC090045 TaxID=3365927 RepID=UPI0037FD651C
MVEPNVENMQAALPAYAIEVGTEPLQRPTRNSLGGWPFFEAGQQWPECFCGERMTLFFQLDIPADVGPFSGDHLSVFHCHEHNDATDPQMTNGRLVPRYWDAPQPPLPSPFWRVLLQRNATQEAPEPDPSVCALPLALRSFEDTPTAPRGIGAQMFKVGGTPSWAQDPEYYRCACGAELMYVCQVPENMEFAVSPDAPEQPYSMPDSYGLFLGNEVYLLACPDHCDPAAVWPVNQH